VLLVAGSEDAEESVLVSGRSRPWHLSWTAKKSRRTTSEQELALLEEDL